MPRIKRWFPVSRDIFSDPQITELIETFGHEGFVMWMAFLKMAEDDEGAIIARSYAALAGSMAALSRLPLPIADKALRAFVKWRWVSQEWYSSENSGTTNLVFRLVNYGKYHPTQRVRPIPSFSTPPKANRRIKYNEGEERINQAGYIQIFHDGRWQLLHQMVAESALGKPLPTGAIVHHVNLKKTLNVNQNLVICQDVGYHNLLHRRTFERFEIDASGHFIRKERESYLSEVGAQSHSLLSYPSDPSDPKNTRPATPEPSAGSKKQNGLDPAIKLHADVIYRSDTIKFARLITWIKQAQKHRWSDESIALALERFVTYAATVRDWWPYLDRLIEKADKDLNSWHAVEAHERFRAEVKETAEIIRLRNA